eukprot:CAMPEP_0180511990 /NCGR_PEP_ID=MMETSP1036_2-20121128/51334_1 /TAXON_ID=632150 /ORGANISM="Azadinium spinosum, Strain 3D9" /LENGTH=68 /DNA_ID=CAMNT_0022523069 /DNA_START=75 /DNA_END=278 /DNA_ORIENTATION=+
MRLQAVVAPLWHCSMADFLRYCKASVATRRGAGETFEAEVLYDLDRPQLPRAALGREHEGRHSAWRRP